MLHTPYTACKLRTGAYALCVPYVSDPLSRAKLHLEGGRKLTCMRATELGEVGRENKATVTHDKTMLFTFFTDRRSITRWKVTWPAGCFFTLGFNPA